MKLTHAQKPIAYIDTETTGLNPAIHEVIEVAIVFDLNHPINIVDKMKAVGISLRVKDDYAYWHTKIKPEHIENAEPIALKVNGYDQDSSSWDAAPTLAEVAITIEVLLQDTIICGHNVAFDDAFLNASLGRVGIDSKISQYKIDTVTLAYEQLLPVGLKYLSLNAIRDFFGWETCKIHDALSDTLACRAFYKKMSRASWFTRTYYGMAHRFRQWQKQKKKEIPG